MPTYVRSAAALILALLLIPSCHKDNGDDSVQPEQEPTYDVQTLGVPKFVSLNYIDLSKIHQISRFRSAVGHDYWDDFEQCRSLKHYFEPSSSIDWASITITSPVSGSVLRINEEWAGTQVQIRCDDQPAFIIIIFHIALASPLAVGDHIQAGQVLGHHIGSQTMSDIAVGVVTGHGYKLVSWFDIMTDAVFQQYQARGVSSRSAMIITKEERDADPIGCAGDAFLSEGTLANWVVLQ